MSRSSPEALLRRLEWTALRRLDGLLQGDYRTLFRGFGLDLADLREYQYGDDVRHIDWNVTARLQTPYVREFQDWMKRSIDAKDVAALLDYRQLAPNAVRAHPTDEHLLPLFVALGAAGACGTARRFVEEVTYGVIAMDAYVFEPAGELARAGETALT